LSASAAPEPIAVNGRDRGLFRQAFALGISIRVLFLTMT
jgi:hypothetical protein